MTGLGSPSRLQSEPHSAIAARRNFPPTSTTTTASGGGVPRQICTFFAMGGCNRGASCSFSHELTQTAPDGVDATGGFFISGNVANYRPGAASAVGGPSPLHASTLGASSPASSPTGTSSPSTLNPEAKAFHVDRFTTDLGSPTVATSNGDDGVVPPPHVAVRLDQSTGGAVNVSSSDMITTLMKMTAVPSGANGGDPALLKSGRCGSSSSSLGSRGTYHDTTKNTGDQRASSTMQLSSSSASGRSSPRRTNSNVSSADGSRSVMKRLLSYAKNSGDGHHEARSSDSSTHHDFVEMVSVDAGEPSTTTVFPSSSPTPSVMSMSTGNIPTHQPIQEVAMSPSQAFAQHSSSLSDQSEVASLHYKPKYTQSQRTFASGSSGLAGLSVAVGNTGSKADANPAPANLKPTLSGSNTIVSVRPLDLVSSPRSQRQAPFQPQQTQLRVGTGSHVPAPRSSVVSQTQQQQVSRPAMPPRGNARTAPSGNNKSSTAAAHPLPHSQLTQTRLGATTPATATVPPVPPPSSGDHALSHSQPRPPITTRVGATTTPLQHYPQQQQQFPARANVYADNGGKTANYCRDDSAPQRKPSQQLQLYQHSPPQQPRSYKSGHAKGHAERAQTCSRVGALPPQAAPIAPPPPQPVPLPQPLSCDNVVSQQAQLLQSSVRQPCQQQFLLLQPQTPQLQVQLQPQPQHSVPQQTFVLAPTNVPGQYALVPLGAPAGNSVSHSSGVFVLDGNTLRCMSSSVAAL